MNQNISDAAANAPVTSCCTDGEFDTPSRSEAEIDLDASAHEHQPALETAQAIKQVAVMSEGGTDHIWYFTGDQDDTRWCGSPCRRRSRSWNHQDLEVDTLEENPRHTKPS